MENKKINFSKIHQRLLKRHGKTWCFDDMVTCAPEHFVKVRIYRDLLEVADYLNEGWKPNHLTGECGVTIQNDGVKYINNKVNDVYLIVALNNNEGMPVFKNEELAQQAIKIIGKQQLKKLFI